MQTWLWERERVPGEQRTPHGRDVCLGGEGGRSTERDPARDAPVGGVAGTVCGAEGFSHQGEEGGQDSSESVLGTPWQGEFSLTAQEAWVMVQAEELTQKVRELHEGRQYEVKEVFVQQEEGFFQISDTEDLAVEDAALVRVQQTARGVMEEWTEDIRETYLTA